MLRWNKNCTSNDPRQFAVNRRLEVVQSSWSPPARVWGGSLLVQAPASVHRDLPFHDGSATNPATGEPQCNEQW